MQRLEIQRDRCNGESTIPHITASNVQAFDREFVIDVPLGDDPDFAIYFDAGNGQVGEALLDAARSLMARIGAIDNAVQECCARECERTGLHPRNYEGELAFVTLSLKVARLRYFGTAVNTEWDEVVEIRNGLWEHVGTATPDLSSRVP
jgi:hypothetical protein